MQRLWRRTALAAAPRRFSAGAATAAPSAASGAPRPPRVEAALVVRDLPPEATADDVRAAFALASDVRTVRVPLDPDTQLPRGFAVVTVVTAEARRVRDELHGSLICGGAVSVQELTTANNMPRTQSSTFWQDPPSKPFANAGGAAALRAGTAKPHNLATNQRIKYSESAAEVLAVFAESKRDFNVVNVATSLYQIGSLSRTFTDDLKPAFKGLVFKASSSVFDDAEQWEARHLANSAWAIAKLRCVDAPALFAAIDKEARKKNVLNGGSKIETFAAQNLANIAWAYASAGYAAPKLFRSIAIDAPKKIA
ncbi:hypothetical protein M885DRAFT_492666, partial [Pelagophyceae sp. CCMP2097]